jgi:hypothetical protein
MAMTLVTPGEERIGSYEAALERGWSADNVRGKVAAGEELERLRTICRPFSRVWWTAKQWAAQLRGSCGAVRLACAVRLHARPALSHRVRIKSPILSIERTPKSQLRCLSAAAQVRR